MDKQWKEGQVIWRELMSPDAAKSKAFYGELFNWTFEDMKMGGMDFTYSVAIRDGIRVGGIMPIQPGMQAPPAWTAYFSVADVDKTVEAALANGGMSPMKPESLAGVGRFGVIADSTGAFLGLMRGERPSEPSPERPPLGTFCWESLNTTDVEKAKGFYKALGWSIGDFGGMPTLSADDVAVADIEAAPPGVPSHWLSHVVVEKLEAARERAGKLGGKILMPEIAIPNVGRICIISDPAGAVISLFEPAQQPAM